MIIMENYQDILLFYLNGFSKVMDVLNEVPYSKNIPLTTNIGNLLLIFTNLDKKDKPETAKRLHAFEMGLDETPIFDKNELKILNRAILNNNVRSAVMISEVYKKLYNTNSIKQFYRKLTQIQSKRKYK